MRSEHLRAGQWDSVELTQVQPGVLWLVNVCVWLRAWSEMCFQEKLVARLRENS